MVTPMKGGSTLAMAVSGPPMHLKNAGAGQDFVLFDDDRQQQQQGNQPSVLMPSRSGAAESSSAGRPSFDTKSSFTEYRAPSQQSGAHNESPFSSPASKPDDDFGSDAGNGSDPHYGGDKGSGTLAYGTPKSKRQRGHGYSSSWTGGNLQQHRHQIRQPTGGGTLASAMDPSHSFAGYGPSKQSNWSGSDTSPQIHSLSLGDGNEAAAAMSSLFPGASKSPPDNDASMPLSNNNNMMGLQPTYTMPPSGPFNFTSTASSVQQQQQDQRARDQIRNELMGVDSRALKGPLRDIQQGTGQDIAPNMYANLDFSSFGPNAFFPGGQSSSSSSSRSMMPPPGPTRQRSGSLDTSFLSSNTNYFNDNFDTSQMSWNGTFSNDINAFDLQGLDDFRLQRQQQQQQLPQQSQRQFQSSQSSSPPNRPDLQDRQFSARTQQAVDRAKAQKPTRKRMTRDGSGLTISPQEAFLDFPDIDSLIQSSRSLSQGHYANTQQNFFAPPPPGIEDILHSSSDSQVMTPRAASYEAGGQFNPPLSLASAHEGTPSLVDASSNSSNGSRATSIISSPLQRMPLNREDTVRPSKSQLSLLSQQGSNNAGTMFSPAYSTSSSTDDEDEKPYETTKAQQQSLPVGSGWQFPFPAQNKEPSAGTSQQALHSGPRFSVVSSSSSESDDDDQRGRGSKASSGFPQGRRSMGGYGYMGSSQESGLNASTSSITWPSMQGIQAPQHQHHQMQQQQQPMQSNGSSPYSSPATNTNMHSSGISRAHDRTPQSAGGQSDGQSQDDAPSLSPSIRSSAQAITQGGDSRQQNANAAIPSHALINNQARQRSRSRNRAQGGGGHIAPTSSNAVANRRTSEAGSSSYGESSEWETGEESEADGSDYSEVKGATSSGPKTAARKRRRGGAANRQGAGAHNSAPSASHLTVCDYVSPLTGEACRTEFHRPYDLARHRETIHAREEALLLRQGRLTKSQCIVLHKEVDPAKSLATVEWKCEGRNGCGSLFSRKDALLRHKRIRGH